jgi:Xaa-Pro aminopeptidase
LTGFEEADSFLVLIPGRSLGEVVLFCQPKNKLKELWQGKVMGPAKAVNELGVDQAFSIDDIQDVLPRLLLERGKIYFPMGSDEDFDKQVIDLVHAARFQDKLGVGSLGQLQPLGELLDELRLLKSYAEIKLMQRAADITAEAHRRAMKACKPGVHEYEMEAELMYAFLRGGSRAPAYNSIVGAGDNSCILHYIENKAEIRDGDLVLIDAGCEYQHYASDVTRTFPANGKFSNEQAEIYEIVLAAQIGTIEAIKPGVPWGTLQDISVRIITAGLIKLGLIEGVLSRALKDEAYKEFYMHRVGHWIGMDVHDVGNYRMAGNWRPLVPGMVTTIEPGIYISPNNRRLPKKWRGIGVRIEDDVLVTKTGHRILSKGIPKTIVEIEAFMNEQT